MFNLTNVEIDGKKKEVKKNDSRMKLPKAIQQKRTQSVSEHRRDRQQSQAAIKGEQKIGTLQGILDDMKHNKITERIDQRNGKALLSIYEKKITDNFNKLYEPNNKQNINKEIKILEKQKFLEQEINKNEVEYIYRITNALKYQLDQKKIQLNNILQQTKDLENVFPTQNQIEILQLQFEDEKQYQALLENELFTSQSLDYIKLNRIKIINHVKRECKDYMRKLKFIKSQYETNSNFHFKRKENLLQLNKKIKSIQIEIDNAGIKNNLYFKDQMCDQLSEFEETRAVNQIYKHGEEIIHEQEIQIQKDKKALIEKQQLEKNKAFDKIRNERIIYDVKLKDLQADFDKIKQVTSGNIKKASDIIEHKQFLKESLINLNGLQIKSQDNLNELKSDINDLKDELKKQQLNKEYEEENYKIYELEAEFLDQEKLTKNKEQNQFRLQKIIDDCSLLMQTKQNQKKMNVQVNQEQISNLLSISGLKLERMLTMIYKKKRNFKIESINYEFNQERPPNYIGLNAQISKDAFTGFLNIDINKKDKYQELDSVNEDTFLKQERSILREKEKNTKEIKKKY